MRQRGITGAAALLILMNILVFSLAAWKIWQANHPQPKSPAVEAPAPVSKAVTVTSAKGAFSITFPAGWDQVIRVTDSDRFIVEGPQQPVVRNGVQAKVENVTSLMDDEALVLDVAVGDDFPAPDGDAIDFLAGKGKYLLSGRKYSFIYTGNGLSQTRKNGDKDYVYSFPLGGKRELRMTYRVFAADPTDNSKVIDTIVRSIHKYD